jgi:hypothetical protein
VSYQLELMDPKKNSKLVSDDRIFKLALIDKKAPSSSTGLVDRRLFTGENKLHAVKDPQFGLWSVKYEHGPIPETLRQSFTSFKILVKVVTDYFAKRNIQIEEIFA